MSGNGRRHQSCSPRNVSGSVTAAHRSRHAHIQRHSLSTRTSVSGRADPGYFHRRAHSVHPRDENGQRAAGRTNDCGRYGSRCNPRSGADAGDSAATRSRPCAGDRSDTPRGSDATNPPHAANCSDPPSAVDPTDASHAACLALAGSFAHTVGGSGSLAGSAGQVASHTDGDQGSTETTHTRAAAHDATHAGHLSPSARRRRIGGEYLRLRRNWLGAGRGLWSHAEVDEVLLHAEDHGAGRVLVSGRPPDQPEWHGIAQP